MKYKNIIIIISLIILEIFTVLIFLSPVFIDTQKKIISATNQITVIESYENIIIFVAKLVIFFIFIFLFILIIRFVKKLCKSTGK